MRIAGCRSAHYFDAATFLVIFGVSVAHLWRLKGLTGSEVARERDDDGASG